MVKIIIEGDPEEVARTVIRLGKESLANEVPVVEQEREQAGAIAPDSLASWTPQEVSELLRMVTKDARRILEEIARNPNGYSFHDLQTALNMDGLNIAGRLSSLGHQLRRYKGKVAPVTRDYSRRAYFMLPEVAQAIRELVKEE